MSSRAPLESLGVAPGEIIAGKFRLEERIGSGGYGEVWRAEQRTGETAGWREVALKLMPLETNGAGGAAGEADHAVGEALAQTRAASAVECDALATVFDVDVDRARSPRLAFLSMELLRGETLEERLARGPIYWRRALAIARDVARALSACHGAKVVHCDLKPQNVFLTEQGRVVVLDFGVAALRAEPGHGAARAHEPRRLRGADEPTEPMSVSDVPGPALLGGPVVGTNGYIAPERFGGGEAGPAVDVYALGVVLYRMIAGRLPHAGLEPPPADDSKARARYEQALVNATVQGDLQPLATAAPDTPRALCELVDALLRRASERLPASELANALERVWQRPTGVPDPPYAGLAAFGAERTGFLAGRDADVDVVAARLERGERVVVLCGPSGAGKSSLAVAGIAPRIDEKLCDGADGWRTVTVRPSQPGALALATVPASKGGAGARVGLVVVVDQLEELVALEPGARDDFCAAFVALAQGREPVSVAGERVGVERPVRVLATVRDDLFGHVAQLEGLERIPEKSLYTVRGVDPNAARDIVAGPARAAGFEVEALERVTREAAELMRRDATALPLVQFALTLWWDARDREQKILCASAWDALGGIEGALGSVAEELYRELDERERGALRRLLVGLFNVDGTRAAPRPIERHPGSARVREELVRRRLVRQRNEGGAACFEVVHEALATRWPTLQRWLEASRAERQLAEDLERDAARFATVPAGHKDDLLWRGRRLGDALALVAERAHASAAASAAPASTRSGDKRETPGPASRSAAGPASVRAGAASGDARVLAFVKAARARERRERFRKRAPLAALVALLFGAVTIGLVMVTLAQRETERALGLARERGDEAARNEARALELLAMANESAARAAAMAQKADDSSALAASRAEEAKRKADEAEEARRNLEKAIKDNRACQGAIHKMLGDVTRPEP